MNDGVERTNTELKPCPFCGGKMVYIDLGAFCLTFTHRGKHGPLALCDECGATIGLCIDEHGTAYTDFTKAEDAAEAWNTRHERTCRIEEQGNDWRCSACGEVVGTCDCTDERYIDGNAIELWEFCPYCGAKRVGE